MKRGSRISGGLAPGGDLELVDETRGICRETSGESCVLGYLESKTTMVISLIPLAKCLAPAPHSLYYGKENRKLSTK